MQLHLLLVDNFFEVCSKDGNNELCENEGKEKNYKDEEKQSSPVNKPIRRRLENCKYFNPSVLR